MLGNDKRANFVYTMNVAEGLGMFRTERESIIDNIISDLNAMIEDGHMPDRNIVDEVADAYDVNLTREEWQQIYDECDLIW